MPTTTKIECMFPGCTRPVGTGEAGTVKMCDAHFAAFEAEGALEDWVEAKRLLTPWVDAAKVVGNYELIIAMQESMTRIEEEIVQHKTALEEATKAL